MSNVLFSSLGRSPGVVTGTVDALVRAGYSVSEVVTFSTADLVVQDGSVKLLRYEFDTYYEGKIAYADYGVAVEDLLTPADNLVFANLVASYLVSYRKQGRHVIISLAGGRKTMSAAMALMAQLFGARMLCHVLVSPTLERMGSIRADQLIKDAIPRLSRELRPTLHPEEADLVVLPFVSLFPALSGVMAVLKGQQAPIAPDVATMLRESHLVNANGEVTAAGRELLELLEQVEMLPEPTSLRPDEKEIKLPSHHGVAELQPLAEKLVQSPFVVAVRSTAYRPYTGRAYEVDEQGNITCSLMKTDARYSLYVKTTAVTKGQGQRVADILQLDRLLR